MIFSVTERGTFKRCRKKWDYDSRNRQNLSPISVPTALSLGHMVHEAQAQWLDKYPGTTLEEIFLQVANVELIGMQDRYSKATDGAPPSDDELGRFYDAVDVGRRMMINYQAHWETPLPEGFTLIKQEQTALVPVMAAPEDPSGYHWLEGTFDGIIRGPDGRLFVLERKTYNQRPNRDSLDNNDQFLAYLWLLSKLDIGPVGGVFYDGMWKRDVDKRRTLSDLFMRTLLVRGLDELANFEQELLAEFEDLVQPGGPRIYRNFRWEGCWDCAMARLCRAEYKGDDAQYVREQFYTQREGAPWLVSQMLDPE